MAWGLFDKLFKRSSSQVNIKLYFFFLLNHLFYTTKKKQLFQPPMGSANAKKNMNPVIQRPKSNMSIASNDMASKISSMKQSQSSSKPGRPANYVKSFGETNPDLVDTDDEVKTKWIFFLVFDKNLFVEMDILWTVLANEVCRSPKNPKATTPPPTQPIWTTRKYLNIWKIFKIVKIILLSKSVKVRLCIKWEQWQQSVQVTWRLQFDQRAAVIIQVAQSASL